MDDSPRERPLADSVAAASERPTLKTIARLSGLAVPTVSRALNDAPDIGEDTKRRVKEIADRIAYRPNRAGVRLRTGRTNVIALILSTESDMMNHTGRLISSVAAGLRGTQFHLNITPFFPSEDPMAPLRYIVETASADAVILNQIETRDARVRYLMDRDFPFVTHGRTEWCDAHAYYDYDNTEFGRIAVDALAAKGRRRILMLPPPRLQNYSFNMIAGAQHAAERHGVDFDVVSGATADSPSAEIERVTAACFAAVPPPDGLIVPSAAASMAVVTVAEDLGLELGVAFDLMAKEATPFLRRFRRNLLTVREDVGHAGGFLAQAAIHRIQHKDEPPMQRLDRPEIGSR